jgi:hypothetical protein
VFRRVIVLHRVIAFHRAVASPSCHRVSIAPSCLLRVFVSSWSDFVVA